MPIYLPLVEHLFFQPTAIRIAQTYPELQFTKEQLETFPEYGKFKSVFKSSQFPLDGIDFHIDNRHVSLHTDNPESGRFLSSFELALDALMPYVPGMEKHSEGWANSRYRFGYKAVLDTRTAKEEDRRLILANSVGGLMMASNAFVIWLRQRRFYDVRSGRNRDDD